MKNTSNLAPITAAVALCGILALLAFAPVSASSSSFSATTEYLPAQVTNQGKDAEPAVYEYGEPGLSTTFPAVEPASWTDSTPEMYS